MKSIWEQTRKEGIISKAIEPYVKLAAESTIIREYSAPNRPAKRRK